LADLIQLLSAHLDALDLRQDSLEDVVFELVDVVLAGRNLVANGQERRQLLEFGLEIIAVDESIDLHLKVIVQVLVLLNQHLTLFLFLQQFSNILPNLLYVLLLFGQRFTHQLVLSQTHLLPLHLLSQPHRFCHVSLHPETLGG
jgi:hypothetical protein